MILLIVVLVGDLILPVGLVLLCFGFIAVQQTNKVM